jgi:hypothetical protein
MRLGETEKCLSVRYRHVLLIDRVCTARSTITIRKALPMRTITIRKALPMRLGDALPLPDLESSLHWVLGASETGTRGKMPVCSIPTITIRKALPMRLGDALPLPDLESGLVALGKPISHSDSSLRTITIRKALPMRLADALR